MKQVSVIIPNFNGKDLIESCVKSLESQEDVDFDVIVIDDGSTDNSVEIIKGLPVKLLENKVNRGFAYTVNRGIKESKAPYILLLNNDVIIQDPLFLKKMVNMFKADDLIFSVSSKMVRFYEREYLDDTGDEYTLFGWVYKRGDGLPVSYFPDNTPIFSACAGAGMYRREVFEKIGYLDPLHFAYLEDVDLGWRAQIYGYRNMYCAESECFHIGSATFAQGKRYSQQKVYLSARNNIYIIVKNMPLFQVILNFPFLALGFTIKYLYFLKRGFGKSYYSGLIEGIKGAGNLTKVSYNKKHLTNYLKIEKEMVKSTIRYTGLKLSQLAVKIARKITGLFKENSRTAVE